MKRIDLPEFYDSLGNRWRLVWVLVTKYPYAQLCNGATAHSCYARARSCTEGGPGGMSLPTTECEIREWVWDEVWQRHHASLLRVQKFSCSTLSSTTWKLLHSQPCNNSHVSAITAESALMDNNCIRKVAQNLTINLLHRAEIARVWLFPRNHPISFFLRDKGTWDKLCAA